MDASRNPIILNQTVVPDYRLPLFEALLQRYGPSLTVTCGAASPTTGMRSCDRAPKIARLRRNVAILGRQLLWQSGLIEDARRTPLLITEFNMRAASTWAAVAERHASGLPTVLWGHARGRNWALNPLRRWMLQRAEGFIAYTDSQAEAIRQECPWLYVRTAPNAVMWMHDCHAIAGAEGNAWDVLFVGRLISEKKPMLALHAFADAVPRLPRQTRLVFVGAGPEATRLTSEAVRLGLQDRVHLHGHEADLESLRRIYGQAVVSVSPGYVGLSATQSFAFGVPMLVAEREPHSPEIEACVEGVSARFFASNSPPALASLLVAAFEQRDAILRGRKSLAAWTAERYSLDRMMQTFESIIDEFLMAPVSPPLTP